MKRIFVVFMALISLSTIQAQGILFLPTGTKFEQAVQKATNEGKLIFLDCFTSWCGPCKMMARNIFPLKEVGDAINPHYISIQIDMEKGEGPELAKRLQISAYPTFIIFNNKGQELGRFLGGSDATTFVKKVKTASVDNGSMGMDKRFAEGERSTDFLLRYINTLGNAYKHDQCNEVAQLLLDNKAETFASDSTLSSIFVKYLQNPLSLSAIYTTQHPENLAKTLGDQGERIVYYKLRQIWSRYGISLINVKDGNITLDSVNFQKWINAMERYNVKDRENYRFTALQKYYTQKAEWDNYIKLCEDFWKTNSDEVTDLELCKWATPLQKGCKNISVTKRLAKLIDERYKDIVSGKRAAQTTQGNMHLAGNLAKTMSIISRSLKGENVDIQAEMRNK